MRNSALSLAWNALSGHRRWPPFWRAPEPRADYDVVIVGGGGHGLATAYYLATRHGLRNVAVLERDRIGGGNTGRNTTIVRSNYLAPESVRFYDFSLRQYEGLSRELDYNVMFSQRGVVNLAFSRHELRQMRRRVEALRHQGVDATMLDNDAIQQRIPRLRLQSPSGRRVFGGFIQERGGTVRHDAVAWGYARAADANGVHIIQDCEVTGFEMRGADVAAVQTTRGRIGLQRLCLCTTAHTSGLAAKLGFAMPITSIPLQAMVSEPVKPVLDVVLDGAFYLSQSDRGELVIGGLADAFNSFAQRSGLQRVEDNMTAMLDLFPSFGRLRFLRQWAGATDLTPDSSPIIGPSPVPNVFLNCGWGSYGFKAIPGAGLSVAQMIADGRVPELVQPFSLTRFETGALIDEGGSAGMDDREPLL